MIKTILWTMLEEAKKAVCFLVVVGYETFKEIFEEIL